MSSDLTEKRVVQKGGPESKGAVTHTRVEQDTSHKVKKIKVSLQAGTVKGVSVKIDGSFVSLNLTAPVEYDVKQTDDVFLSVLWDVSNATPASVLCEYSRY